MIFALTDRPLQRLTSALVVLLCITLLTSTALTNICMALLVPLSLWVWSRYRWPDGEWALARPLFILIVLFCLWDLGANLLGGNSLIESLQALRRVRKFFFVLLLWPLFASPKVARHALFSLGATVSVLAFANLVWTRVLHHSEYMTSFMPNLHGQILVGMVLLLAHLVIERRYRPWLLGALALLLLLASLFFASERRTGYVLLVAGGVLMLCLHWQRQTGRRRLWALSAGLAVLASLLLLASLSATVQQRVALFFAEYQQFFQMAPQQRSQLETSVGLRLQYFVSSWVIVQDHFWTGVGSLNFKSLFWEVNRSMGATNPQVFPPNPHNEYLYMWATKGLIGLLLYLGIFVQACRMAAQRAESWQRHGLWLFVCLFLTSILFNSMSINMVEGHFMMLVLLIFLAPARIWSTTGSGEDPASC
jgi:O-antigen ligase